MSKFSISFPVLAAAYALSSFSTFFMNVVLGRNLGAAALGVFAVASSVIRISYAATDLGLGTHLTRNIARDRSKSQHLLSLFVTLRASVVPLVGLLAFAYAMAVGESNSDTFILLAIAQGIISLQLIYEGLLQAHEKQSSVAVLTGLNGVAVITTSWLWFAAEGGLRAFVGAYVLASTIGLFGYQWWARRSVRVSPRWTFKPSEWLSHIREAWPIGASMLMGVAALRAPIVVLGMFCSPADAGAFAATDMFVSAATLGQAAVTNASFPTLAASFRKEPRVFGQTLWRANLILVAMGLATSVVLALFGDLVAQALLKNTEFDRIASIMPIVAWSTPMLLLVHHNISVFAAADTQKQNLRFMTVWFTLIAGLELIIVPTYGLVGAAWALLIGRFLGLLVLMRTLFAAGIHRGGASEYVTRQLDGDR